MKYLQLPYGVQDYLPDECYNKIRVENTLAQVFDSYGFAQVEPPTLEYEEVYRQLGQANLNKMFKLTDNDGSLLVMRSDPTVQICRMVTTRLSSSSINKLFYRVNSFEYLSGYASSRTREFAQMGVELIGDTGISGDIELINMAIESFLKCDLDEFLIEVGQVDFFKGLMQEIGLSESDSEQLRLLINTKDMLGVELYLKQKNISKAYTSKVLMLPSLFGDITILDKAEKICNNKTSFAALDNLRQVFGALNQCGYGKYVSIDLGMVQGLGYYSGIVLRGVSKNMGMSLLDGGRYDNLTGSFGKRTPALGFSVGIKRLLIALEKQSKLTKKKPIDFVYISKNCSAKFEHDTVSEYREQGKIVSRLYTESEQELISFCEENGVQNALVLSDGTARRIKLQTT